MTDPAGKVLRVAYLAGLASFPALLGAVYATYNTDPHHWGFILGTALDYMRGRSLFSEVFIQYGAGQPLLLDVLGHVMPINYTTIGFVASAAYALTLVVLFLCMEKVTATIHAAAITAIAFLVHPYAIYPWPDYLAGLCLCCACYCMVKRVGKASWVAPAASGLFLFLAFLFRNTYLVNILVAIAVYGVVVLLGHRARCKEVIVAILAFALLTCGYFAFLYMQGNLGHWYRQNFGAAAGSYGMGSVNVHTLILSIVYPQDLGGWIFTGLVASNLWMMCLLLFSKDERAADGRALPSGIVIFIALLGLCGFVQGLQFYETFRVQNAGISLYLGFACLLSLWFPRNAQAHRRIGLNLSLGALVVALLANFSSRLEGGSWSITWPMIEPPAEGSEHRYSKANLFERYSTLDIAIFNGHRFQPGVKNYYEELSKYLCDGRRRIVNLTRDSTIPYLCVGQENALHLPYYSLPMLSTITPTDAEAIENIRFAADEVVVTDSTRGVFASPSSVGLERIGTVRRPASIRWLKPGEVSVFHVLRGQ